MTQADNARETEDFLAEVLPRQLDAGTAIHNGEAGPWMSLWSQEDPVTLFGARVSRTGATGVAALNERLGAWFRDCSSYDVELVAAGASGDIAYTVAYERTTASVEGAPAKPYTLRVTHVYRREAGAWWIVHRHGDGVPDDPATPQTPAGDLPALKGLPTSQRRSGRRTTHWPCRRRKSSATRRWQHGRGWTRPTLGKGPASVPEPASRTSDADREQRLWPWPRS